MSAFANPPADPITATLDAIIARLKDGFGFGKGTRSLRSVEMLEFAFDREADKVVQVNPPALYIVPLAFRPKFGQAQIETRWVIYAVSNRATPLKRTKGDAQEMGSFGIAVRASALLNEWVPPVAGASALNLTFGENLTGMTLVKKKLSVVALTLTGVMEIGLGDPATDLDDFLHYHSDWDIAPHADPAPDALTIPDPDAINDVILEGAEQ